MVCCAGSCASWLSEIGSLRLGERFSVRRVLAERPFFSRYLAFDHRVGDIRLVELQRIDPHGQTAWRIRAETACRLHHPALVPCLEAELMSDGTGMMVFDAPVDSLLPERLETDDVVRIGVSLASLLALLHRAGFGFLVPLLHRAYLRHGEGGPLVQVEALSRAVGGLHPEPFCARCFPDVPPEMAGGDPPSPSGDLFILGAFLFRLMNGRPLPVAGLEDLGPVEEGPARDVARLVQADPRRRPSSAAAVCQSFMRHLTPLSSEREPPACFGYIDPGPEPCSLRRAARAFVVPGLSPAAVERLAEEVPDRESLEAAVNRAAWDIESRRRFGNEKLERALRLEMEGEVAKALEEIEGVVVPEAAMIEARLAPRCERGARLEHLGRRLPPPERKLLNALLFRQQGRLEQAEQVLCDPDVAERFESRLERGLLALIAGKAPVGVEMLRQAASKASSPAEEARARGRLGLQLARMGRLREAEEQISVSRQLVSGEDCELVRREIRLWAGEMDFLTGRWARAAEALGELLPECRSAGDGWACQEALLLLAELEALMGERPRASHRIEEALQISTERGDLEARHWALLLELENLATRETWGMVLKRARLFDRRLGSLPFLRLRTRLSLLLGRAALECGKLEMARRALENARQGVQCLSEPALRARVERLSANCLAREGRVEDAVRAFDGAIQTLEGTCAPHVLAELYTEFVLVCSGAAPQGLVDLRKQTARRIAAELGAKTLLEALNGCPSSGEEARAPLVPGIVASSPAMVVVLDQIRRAAPYDLAVHIKGESGTGKELVARALHDLSPRSKGRFVALNCAAIPDALLEAELFGHVRGAFTGADRIRRGLIEEADGGTLFLDEVADLTPRGQTLLLRVLQDKEFRRLGDSENRRSNFRFVSATHKCLEEAVGSGRFREDLYFRLKVIEIELPPLKERREDVVALIRHFLESKASELRLPVPSLDLEAEKALVAYSWPGNVRELENEILQALLRLGTGTGLRLRREHLSPRVQGVTKIALRFAHQDLEKRYLREALVRHGGNRTRAAHDLGMTRQGLYKKLRKHGLEATACTNPA